MQAMLQALVLVAIAALPSSRQEDASRSATGVSLPLCAERERLAYMATPAEVDAHRQGPRQVIRYEPGSRQETYPQLVFPLRVDGSGRVVCWMQTDAYNRPIKLSSQRRQALQALAATRYTPFVRDGVPVAAIVREWVGEEDIPLRQRPMPKVPLEQVKVRLERTGCFGTCPAYRVEIDGSGSVTYTGLGFVDVRGTHRYSIDPREVSALVERARLADFWSLSDAYRASVTDNPTTTVSFVMGAELHAVEDYVGLLAGMPRAMKELEDAIDAAARSDRWINLSSEAVEALVKEGFNFHAEDGASLLFRATDNADTHDDAALVRLMELGAPFERAPTHDEGWQRDEPRRPLIEEALELQREALVEGLLARGALGDPANPDPQKLDAAFQAAIRGGDLALVQRIWNFSTGAKPSLVFTSRNDPEESQSPTVIAPVTLLLERRPWVDRPWQGLEIAQWLNELGCDLRAHAADGDTLLHAAARAGDAPFVGWLLAQGVDPSAPGEFDLPPLGSVSDEEVAMLLLQAGGRMGSKVEFVKYARERNWPRVVAWLEMHP